MANPATNNALLTGGYATVVLNPEHAQIFSAAGLTRQDIAEGIFQHAYIDGPDLKRLSPAFAGSSPDRRMAFKNPEQILIVVAGGSGLYSMVMPSWSTGAHNNSPSSVVVEADFFCEIPAFSASAG